MCKALEYNKKHVSVENYAHKYDLSKWSVTDHLLNWLPDSRKLRSKVWFDQCAHSRHTLAFNKFEEEGHVERKFNHFWLIDYTRDNLYDMGISGGDYDED